MVNPVASSDISTRLVGILWGEIKCGKTTYAMTLPGKKLIVNFDPDGYQSVLHRDDFDVIDFSEMEPREAMNEARKLGSFLKSEEGKVYKSVIFDSLTTFAFIALRNAIEEGVGKSRTFTPTMDNPGLSAYGGRNNRVNDVIDRLMRATSKNKQHLFFIAHIDDPEMDGDGKTVIQQTIMLPSKIRNLAGIKVSEVYYLEETRKGRIIRLKPHGVKRPMGSRIFDTSLVEKLDLTYDINVPDEDQADTLSAIFAAWETNGREKLAQQPRKQAQN